MKKIFILSAIVLIGYFQSKAQNILTTPLTWSVTQLTDLNTNATQSYQCTFQTNGTQTIQWVQKKLTTGLEITSTSGTWSDVSAYGKMVFNITADGETGSITFEKDETGTSITIDLSQSGQTRLRQRYMVTNVQ